MSNYQHTWSFTVKVTHWLVALGVLLNMFNDTGYTHRTIGYVCIALILMRILHGMQKNVVASSRFYLPSISQAKQHVKAVFADKTNQHHGHNPLGMWAIYIMWMLIALLAFTGWLSRTDAFWGEDGPVILHQFLSNALLIVIVVHVIAVFVMSKLEKRNLIKQMIAGKTQTLKVTHQDVEQL